ncbi:transporter [Ectothiorhodospiraceae bacterium BW-2]|nr:transporter [Ectothiorhodospiraceae bacterium BW-2]
MSALSQHLSQYYYRAVLEQRWLWLGLILLLLFSGYSAREFKLDASADALVLESDADLRFYREVRARYGSDDYLILTYNPQRADLFSAPVLQRLAQLKGELEALERVASVTSILDVPLIQSPPVSLTELQQGIRTLSDNGTDSVLARQEFLHSPLYRQLLVSDNGQLTALMVQLKIDSDYRQLLQQRDQLWQLSSPLTAEQQQQLESLSAAIKQYNSTLQQQQQADIAAVRQIADKYRDQATIYLGGVPMISADIVDFIGNDIERFGLGVTLLILLLLALAFRRLLWIAVPIAICAAVVVVMVGFLGWIDWRVTIVSSNFISLLLIITLSLTIHLVVRYQELQQAGVESQRRLLQQTLSSKLAPSLYTTLTTMVAFASLLVSGIRPVIDFGWMMVVGVAVAFGLAFVLFPLLLARRQPQPAAEINHPWLDSVTGWLAQSVITRGRVIIALYLLLLLLATIGLSRLSVENRFIDYFKADTEIYQGMVVIDQQLGGTTPLDVVISAPARFLAQQAEEGTTEPAPASEQSGFMRGLLDDLFGDSEADAGISASSYWFNRYQLERVASMHRYLASLPETGKVLSLATAMELVKSLNGGEAPDNFTLSLLHKKLPEEIRQTLLDPYMSADGNQIRFSIRVVDSDHNLQRDALLKKIEREMVSQFELEPQQLQLSGMLVLYNNVLQSLFQSQIVTLSAVFAAIWLMLWLLFRSMVVATVGVIPTLMAAGLILGLMGWLSIPLDIMTITIAAITVGIGVDNAIHYIHRFESERRQGDSIEQVIARCHASVGRAIWYTSMTISLGFSVLALSNFMPTLYFGLFTALAMVLALLGNLTLLPLLLRRLRWRSV